MAQTKLDPHKPSDHLKGSGVPVTRTPTKPIRKSTPRGGKK